jgi:NitT/TauT family transport system substrate-binding protein
MVRRWMIARRVFLGLAGLAALAGTEAAAQARTVRIAKQFGISYLPLTLMDEQKLLEQEGKRLGLDLKTEWVQFSSGTPMNEALVSGNIDFVSGGVGPLLTAWAKTQKNLGIKGVAALNAMPLYLNTINPSVKTIKDFTEKDRIALPADKVSIQAVTLQMAAEKVFGPGQQSKLDPLTVSMSHPDGFTAMMGGRSEITAHFTSAPYMYDELADPRMHKVLDSYEVLGGPHTFNAVWTTARVNKDDPKLVEAFIAALEVAMRNIQADPAAAARIWLKAENSKMAVAEAEKLIRLPENEWTTVPKKIGQYAEFMARTGLIPTNPASWKEVFFEQIHAAGGS